MKRSLKPFVMLVIMAEREGFEPPVAFRLRLISSQVHSTGLCHLSVSWFLSGEDSAAWQTLISFDCSIMMRDIFYSID